MPLAHSDFIFTVIAEEFGFIGSSLVIGGFFALTLLGFLVAMKAPDYSGALLAAGITVWFALQATINIGGVVGVMPVTGLTLPLISYGAVRCSSASRRSACCSTSLANCGDDLSREIASRVFS